MNELPSFELARPRRLGAPAAGPSRDVTFEDGALRVVSDDGSTLLVTQLQLPGKRATKASDFANGLRGRRLMRPA